MMLRKMCCENGRKGGCFEPGFTFLICVCVCADYRYRNSCLGILEENFLVFSSQVLLFKTDLQTLFFVLCETPLSSLMSRRAVKLLRSACR